MKKGTKHSESSIEKMKLRKASEETKAKMSESQKKRYAKGKEPVVEKSTEVTD